MRGRMAGRITLIAFLAGSALLQNHVKGLALLEIGRESGPLMGHQAPDFALPDLAGRPVSLAALRARGPVLLDFFVVDCMPCRRGWKALRAIHAKKRERPLTVVAVNLGDPPAKLDRFLQKFASPFAIVRGDQRVGDAYKVKAVPRTLLVSSDGTVLVDLVGATMALATLVDMCLDERKGRPWRLAPPRPAGEGRR